MKITIIPVGMLGTNCYLLASEQNNCVLVDPGAQPEKLARLVEEKGLALQYILLTHGHHDHIGGVKKLLQRFEVPLYIGKEDLEMLQPGFTGRNLADPALADSYVLPSAQSIEEGHTFTLDELTITAMDAPGHTKGGVCYLCGDVLFSGDTLFRGDIGRCDLYGGDYGVMKQTLKKLAALPGDYTVYPGHGESTTLEWERQHNYYMNHG